MKNIIILLLSFVTTLSFGQYTEVINSRRPGFSESPYGIGTKVYQVETGIFYQRNNNTEIFTPKNSYGMDLFLRSGFIWEKLEVNANFSYQKDDILKNTVLGTTEARSGISQFTVGAKYIFYIPKYKDPSKEIRSWKKKWAFDKKRLIPAVGLYLGLNTNFLGSDYKATGLSPKAVLLLQNDFSDYLIWVNNIVGDYLTIGEQRTLGYISTLSYSMTDRFAIFGETQGMFSRYTKEFKFGGGFAYLPSKDMQIDIFVRHEIEFDYLNLYGGLGFSWRMDRHKDKVKHKKIQNDGSGKVYQKKGNFFTRLFNKDPRRGKKIKGIHVKQKRGNSRRSRFEDQEKEETRRKPEKHRRSRRDRDTRSKRNRRSRRNSDEISD